MYLSASFKILNKKRLFLLCILFSFANYATVVGDNINIMKTIFELNFDLYQAFKQHGYTKI